MAAGVMAAALALTGFTARAQVTGSSQTTTDAQGHPQESATITVTKPSKKERVSKDEKVKSTKDTRAEEKKEKKLDPLAKKDADLPDKQLYDKALAQIKSGHFDVARLDLNTLLSTYPDSQYQMRAKLAIADAWYREGGSAALAQAEQEYKDFITFFPNAPEAAEAQMRVGDIYFKQMDVPDRDYSKAQHAEEEYRTMLKQYPDAPKEILAEAQQKLRDVQEVLAQREADIGAFYASHEDWPAALARYETVHGTYPLYSHMDDVLIGMGDAYEAEAKIARGAVPCSANLPRGTQCMPEGVKASVEQQYDKKAADEYREVVLKHSAAPHMEFAKERLAEMNQPIPTPTAEDVASSEKLEGSRAQYTMQKRLELLVMHKPDTVTAAQVGEPPLEDPPPVLAPEVSKSILASYTAAFNPGAAKADAKTAAPAAEPAAGEASGQPAAAPAQPATPAVAATPTLSDVPAAGTSNSEGAPSEVTPASPAGASPSGTGVGVEVLTPGVVNTGSGAASPLNSATGAADPNLGLKAVGPKDNSPLPAVEAPAAAPDQVNDVAGTKQPPAETKAAGQKKNPKPAYDKGDESSSTHKKKKGLDKLNPF
jgi:outer membrane protein assembly factor BamD